jgi:co-chaperonin GroES (HSP10)
MSTSYDTKHIKIRALNKDVIISNMSFDEMKTASGLILRSDDGKSHGIKPRWGQVYKTGPGQTDVKIGQWILVEHGRWSRRIKIHDGESEKFIQKIDVDCILAVSDEPPGPEDLIIGDN